VLLVKAQFDKLEVPPVTYAAPPSAVLMSAQRHHIHVTGERTDGSVANEKAVREAWRSTVADSTTKTSSNVSTSVDVDMTAERTGGVAGEVTFRKAWIADVDIDSTTTTTYSQISTSQTRSPRGLNPPAVLLAKVPFEKFGLPPLTQIAPP
jgi:hypothetical protein